MLRVGLTELFQEFIGLLLLDVQFGGFGGVMRCVMVMPMRQMCMVGCLLFVPSFVVIRRLPVMSSRILEMFGSFMMMFCCLF